jgi:hypothetical protein
MNAIRQIISPKNGKISIDIPKQYAQKRFEVIVLPLDEPIELDDIKAKMTAFLATLPAEEAPLTDVDILNEVKTVRSERYAK